MEEKKWSWEQWLNKLADYSVEIPDTYDEFNGKIKATCSLGSSTDIYHIRFERVNYRGETVVNDIYLNNDEMKVVMDFAERLSDKKLVEEKELDRAREEGRREVYEAIVFDKNIPHDVTTFVAANLWKNMRDKAKEELSKLTTK